MSNKQHQGEIVDKIEGFDVIDCSTCGFRHIDPLPTPEELLKVYRDEYYVNEKPLYLERYREDLRWWQFHYNNRLRSFEEQLPQDRRRILDVGCGPGFFLQTAQQRGWQVLGIEPSEAAAKHAATLGVEVVVATLDEESAQGLGTFDVVHFYNVLEHLPDPAGLLDLAYRLLNPDGLLSVTVPNDYNPFQSVIRQAHGAAPWWLAVPHHVNYFNHQTLRALVCRCGFRHLQSTTTFPMELFLLMGDNYIGDDDMGRQLHAKRKTLELSFSGTDDEGALQLFYEKMADAGLGREAVVLAMRD